jgi:hypothetical protein
MQENSAATAVHTGSQLSLCSPYSPHGTPTRRRGLFYPLEPLGSPPIVQASGERQHGVSLASLLESNVCPPDSGSDPPQTRGGGLMLGTLELPGQSSNGET